MRNTQEYRIAETLTEFLQSNDVIIYDENNPQKVKQQGNGKELKQTGIQYLPKKKYTYQQAEHRVERRLIHLIRKELIWIKSQV